MVWKYFAKVILVLLFFPLMFPFQKAFAINNVFINEFVAHPSTGNKEWVEFYNPDGISISNYWIDDDTDFVSDSGSSTKKSLSTLINSNPLRPYIELSSMLNNDGDHVVLFDNLGNILDQYEYVSDPGEDTAIGRSPDGTGQIQILAEATKGNNNSGPVPTPTPTPSPAPTPTKEPAPTPTKIPTATPTPTKSPTPSPTKSITKTPTPKNSASASADPTSVLGISTKSADKKQTQAKKTPTNQSIIPLIAIMAGSVLLLACAILVYLKIDKNND